MQNEKLLRVVDVTAILQVNRMTLYELINLGVLEAINLNKGTTKRPRYRFVESSIQRFIENQRVLSKQELLALSPNPNRERMVNILDKFLPKE